MKKIGLILLAGFSFIVVPLWAQSDDPSEVFLKAYMTSQQGEKLEHDNQFKAALTKFRFAGSLLEELKKSHADWQPAIVEYRSRKIGENILRVQSKIGTQADLAAASEPTPPATTPLPSQNFTAAAQPSVEIGSGPVRLPSPSQIETRPAAAQPVTAAIAPSAPTDAAIKRATRDLQDKVDQLQNELQKSRSQYSSVQKEKETLNGKLQETNSKLEKAQADLQKSHGAEKTARDQLATAQDSLKKIQTGGSSDAKTAEALKTEIAQLKKALAFAEEGRTAAEKEKAATSAKLNDVNTQVAAITKERDQLIADLKNSKQAADRVQLLV
ncbi:MAG: hypothetical protein ACXWG7_01200, partial [Chthoniobacterales bacterium]